MLDGATAQGDLPQPLAAEEAARLGLEALGEVPGHPGYAWLRCRHAGITYMATLGTGARERAPTPSRAVMVWVGGLTAVETLRLIARAGREAVVWQSPTARDGGTPTWLYGWLTPEADLLEVFHRLRRLHAMLDGIVGDPHSPDPAVACVARLRRLGACVAHGTYALHAAAVHDAPLAQVAARAGAQDTPPAPADGPSSPAAHPDPAPAHGPTHDPTRRPTPCPAPPGAGPVGSLGWLEATVAQRGRWDPAGRSVHIAGAGGEALTLRRGGEASMAGGDALPEGSLGTWHDTYLCYVLAPARGRRSFTICSTLGEDDTRALPALRHACVQAPGARVRVQRIPRPSVPLFLQPADLPPLSIREDL